MSQMQKGIQKEAEEEMTWIDEFYEEALRTDYWCNEEIHLMRSAYKEATGHHPDIEAMIAVGAALLRYRKQWAEVESVRLLKYQERDSHRLEIDKLVREGRLPKAAN